MLTKETFNARYTNKTLPDWLTVVTYVCGRVQKVCLCAGALKDPVETLDLTVVSRVSPYQAARGSAGG